MNHRAVATQAGRAKLDPGASMLLIVLVIVLKLVLLHVMGRPPICPCGIVSFWQSGLDPAQNSQQFADPYSLLHIVFGLFLFLWLNWIRPQWNLPRILVVASISSAIWEFFENMPFIIERFAARGSDLHYEGDSLLNSMGDSLFVLAGTVAASKLSPAATLVAALAIELAVYLTIGDGLVAGLARFVAG